MTTFSRKTMGAGGTGGGSLNQLEKNEGTGPWFAAGSDDDPVYYYIRDV